MGGELWGVFGDLGMRMSEKIGLREKGLVMEMIVWLF